MKIKFKIQLIILLSIIFIGICSTKVLGASISVRPSKSSVSPGESFSVSISANGATGKVSISASNGTVSSSSLWLEPSGTITVKAGSSGSVKISVSAVDMSDSAGNEVSPSGGTTVSIVQPSSNNGSSSNGGSTTKKPTTNNTKKPTETKEEKKSTDSTLSSLKIAEGEITPEFNKDVKEYAITVPNEVTKLNITATPTDSKATVSVTEYEELKEGENAITISVTAEDGTTKTDYVIKATRQKKELALEKLIVKYTNQNGEVVEVPLTPEFISNIYEYSIETLEYWVKSLDIEALANIEGATIEISGADSLKEGENIITITVKNKVAVEAQEEGTEATEQEETKTYTIKFNKNAEPTIIGRISNWFKGIFGGVSTWYINNQQKVIVGGLALCIVALIGLSIYIVIDYKKYKDLLSKVGKINTLNNSEVKVTTEATKNSIEDIYKDRKNEINNEENNDDKPKGGKHF